jgi:hypothetical protein
MPTTINVLDNADKNNFLLTKFTELITLSILFYLNLGHSSSPICIGESNGPAVDLHGTRV